MVDFIIVAVLLVIVGVAIAYMVKAKKSGAKCIGCPAGGNCSHKHSKASGGCGCGCSSESVTDCGFNGDSKSNTVCECGSAENSRCGCHADTKQ